MLSEATDNTVTSAPRQAAKGNEQKPRRNEPSGGIDRGCCRSDESVRRCGFSGISRANRTSKERGSRFVAIVLLLFDQPYYLGHVVILRTHRQCPL